MLSEIVSEFGKPVLSIWQKDKEQKVSTVKDKLNIFENYGESE